MAKKENNQKNPRARELWIERKRAGRPKQVFVPGDRPDNGYWKKQGGAL